MLYVHDSFMLYWFYVVAVPQTLSAVSLLYLLAFQRMADVKLRDLSQAVS